MSKFRIINRLLDTEEGKSFEIVATFNTFEGVADKVVRDLNSIWKGSIPLPFSFRIESVDDSEPEGMSIREDGKELARNDNFNLDAMEIYAQKIREYFADKKVNKK